MELVYLWVEDYKNIHNQGFNFSPRFTCNYDKDSKELTIDENKEYVSIFPENINVTAIVGENGSGKSTIGGYYITKKFIRYATRQSRCILVFNKNDILYAYNDTNIKLKFKFKSFLELENLDQSLKSLEKLAKLYEQKKAKPNSEKLSQTNFINDYLKESKIDLFNNKIKCEFDFLQKAKKDFKDIFPSSSENKEELFVIGKYLFTVLSEFSSRDNHITGNTYRTIRPLERGDINNFDEVFGSFDILNFFIGIIGFRHKADLYTKETKFNISGNDIRFGELSFGEKYIIHTLVSIYFRIKNNQENIIFLDEVTLSMHPLLERRFINLLVATVNKAQEDSLTKIKVHFIITSHSPFILSDLPKENVIFLKDGKQEDVDIETFGANIHTLLSHGFFMKGGLMGEFAKGKINEVIKILKRNRISKKNLAYCSRIISLIGEPVLQKTLQTMFDEKMYSKENELQKLERKQKEIEKQIKSIKEQNEKS